MRVAWRSLNGSEKGSAGAVACAGVTKVSTRILFQPPAAEGAGALLTPPAGFTPLPTGALDEEYPETSLIGLRPLAGVSLTGAVALAWLTLRSMPLMLPIGLAFHRSG